LLRDEIGKRNVRSTYDVEVLSEIVPKLGSGSTILRFDWLI